MISHPYDSLLAECEHLFGLLLFLDILVLRTSDCFLKLAAACSLLVALGLCEHALEDLHSLAHACVQRSLDGMEVIVQVLTEANEECKWLIEAVLEMSWEECELNDTVGIFGGFLTIGEEF